jgi:hypothetical protein
MTLAPSASLPNVRTVSNELVEHREIIVALLDAYV